MVWESTLVPSLHEIFNFPPGGFVFQAPLMEPYIFSRTKKRPISPIALNPVSTHFMSFENSSFVSQLYILFVTMLHLFYRKKITQKTCKCHQLRAREIVSKMVYILLLGRVRIMAKRKFSQGV